MFQWRAFLLIIPAAVVVAWPQTPAPRHPVVLLWAGDAPGSEGKTGDEKVRTQIRTVRARSAEWGVDPNRIGVMGFSAGAELAGLAATHYDNPVKNPVDDLDRQSAKPAFQALIYPPGAANGK